MRRLTRAETHPGAWLEASTGLDTSVEAAGTSACATSRQLVLALVLTALVPLLLAAETTRTWEQTRFDEFERGVADRVALRSDGSLTLAPKFVELYDAPVAYLWALARDTKGNLYAGGGPGARVFKIGPDGKSARFFETDALEIHALALDARDNLYAATSPDAKIYKIDPSGKAALFAAPGTKYIWTLAFTPKGDLLAATGDKGEILRFDAAGKATSFFKCDESHIRSMLVEPNGDVVVGTDPGGLVLRIPAAGGPGFVLYQSSKKEITALARDGAGAIYAAGVGTRSRAPAPPVSLPASAPTPAPLPTTLTGGQAQPAPAPLPITPPSAIRSAVTGGSDVFRIASDGSPRRLWTSNDDVVYALAFDPAGKPLIATGNQGRIYRLENDQVHSLVIKAASSQITGLLQGAGGAVLVATGNVGKVYRLGPDAESSGTFESEVFDAGMFSRWGRLSWKGRTPAGARLGVVTRSGNLGAPAQYWSPWSKPVIQPEGDRVDSPSARFVQWRATLESSSSDSPLLDSVALAYLPANTAPVIAELEVTAPNHKFPEPSSLTPSRSLSLPALGSRPSPRTPAQPAQAPRTLNPARGFLGARWLAQDDNEDDLVYTVEIRGRQEQTWRLLREKLDDPYLNWDSTAFADGVYLLRVTASDAPSNQAPDALEHRRESEPFRIDNTPPAITGLSASPEAGRLRVRFRAADLLSWIEDSEYSLDGGAWKQMLPATRLFDSRQLDFDFLTDTVQPGEHTVAVRLTDEHDNQGVAKLVVR